MNLDERYIDKDNSLRRTIRSVGSTASLRLPSTHITSPPTTSVNLDQTVFQAPISSNNSAILDVSTINDSINTAFTRLPNASNSSFYLRNNNDTNDDDLVDRLAQSMHSGEMSIRNGLSRRWKRPYVCNEIPNVFTVTDNIFDEDDLDSCDKNFFILTSAGKPIYTMHGKDEYTTSLMGIIHTIVNYFQVNQSTNIKIVSTTVSGQKFAFLDKSPIILMAYSRRRETSNELINQLDFIHSYLLSSLTQRQVSRLFNKRENFDLRRFLEVTDFENLDQICSLICDKFYPDILLGSLQCLPLRKSVRFKIHEAMTRYLLKESDLPRGTLLYGLIVAHNGKLCSVLRPKGHTLHTTDLHLLFSLISYRFQNHDNDKELWVPICFPKFNPNGFLYCYIQNLPMSSNTQEKHSLVLISAQKDVFFKLRTLGHNFTENIQKLGLLDQITKSNGFKISDIPAPLVHHFIYKSKNHVQYVMPQLEYNNCSENNIQQANEYETKLKIYYQQIYSTVYRDNGNPFNKTTLNYVKWEAAMTGNETDIDNLIFQEEKPNMLGLAWVTPRFDLFMICNNGVNDKDIVFKSAKKIVSWCTKNESRLFVAEGAVF